MIWKTLYVYVSITQQHEIVAEDTQPVKELNCRVTKGSPLSYGIRQGETILYVGVMRIGSDMTTSAACDSLLASAKHVANYHAT